MLKERLRYISLCNNLVKQHGTCVNISAHVVCQATTPPPAEWNVPHDGPIDKTFSVTAAPELARRAEEDDEEEEEEEEARSHQTLGERCWFECKVCIFFGGHR